MGVLLLISDLKNTPSAYIFSKIVSILIRKIKSRINYAKDLKSGTYSAQSNFSVVDFYKVNDIRNFDTDKLLSDFLQEKFFNNRFDVLGTGYIDWTNSVDLNQAYLKENVNPGNLAKSAFILEELKKIDSNYKPVNWQLEGKSQYQFKSGEHFTKILNRSLPEGTDIKIPWELGRMHHLTTLLPALLDKSMNSSTELLRKVKCHILDFILCNPPSFGVQWTSAMDVSIRLLNLCIMADALRQIDQEIEKSTFYSILLNSINDHIRFAWKFREHKNGLSNNHYLSNLVGLMYGCYFLNSNENEIILRRITKIFWKEVDKQFLYDGGNFESSTNYHVFSTEIAALGLAVCQRMNNKNRMTFEEQAKKDLKSEVLKKIFRASKMIDAIEISDGLIPQIGDNDSARMLYFTFQYLPVKDQSEKNKKDTKNSTESLSRNVLKYKSSMEIISSCFGLYELKSIHSLFIKSIMDTPYVIKDHLKVPEVNSAYSVRNFKHKSKINYPEGKSCQLDLTLNLKMYAFVAFGVYIFKGDNIYLLVNGTNRHVRQYWPHGHNDKLSFELWVGGKPEIRDPGSYTYTANPKKRNEYRSVHSHAVLIFDNQEQNLFVPGRSGVFRLIPRTEVKLLSLDRNSLTLELKYDDYHQIREFRIKSDSLEISDFANHTFEVNKYPKTTFSPGYGKLED